MGLFGGILQGLGGILGSVVGGIDNAKAVKKASKAEQAGMQQAIAEQQRQFDLTRSDFAPYLGAGTKALPGILDLLGLNGADKGLAAIEELKKGPEYASEYANGEEAVLQNASATGGVRGGNTIRGLADFGRDTLAKVLGDHLSRLGGLAGLGAGATDSVAGFGQHKADAIGNLQVGIGQSKAGGILGQQGAYNNMGASIQGLLMKLIPGMGGF